MRLIIRLAVVALLLLLGLLCCVVLVVLLFRPARDCSAGLGGSHVRLISRTRDSTS